LELDQQKDDKNLNQKGKEPMHDATRLGSNSCEEGETLSPGNKIDDDVYIQMIEPVEVNIHEAMFSEP
jgi:hypothetical protein